ncbi:YaaR family protein [Sporolactobacillus pectinivorans]|uniref:YaaR family protein n=1 Tax=Sporolactobacillus pectinivorans TaxID=1591408 RepID=UPI000C25B934|nr:YaaR family protein [Sporolactobacillus pectinivorans]
MGIKISRGSGMKDPVLKQGSSVARVPVSFESTLAGQKASMKMDALKELLNKVDEQAQKVSVSRTVHDVQIYKKYVQAFIQEAVHAGLESEQSRSWQRGGVRQTLIKTIDQKLIALTDNLLDKNKDELGLLDHLDEIRGMLINLYV